MPTKRRRAADLDGVLGVKFRERVRSLDVG
jgi:hypothetical protein